jgi:hypothetical protein
MPRASAHHADTRPRWTGRLVSGLAALIALAVMLACPPLLAAAVVHAVGYPTRSAFMLLGGRLTDTAVLHILTGVTLLAWARFVVCVLVEASAAVARRMPRRIPLIAGVEQAAARHLVAAVLGLVTGVGGLAGTVTAGAASDAAVAAAPIDTAPVAEFTAPAGWPHAAHVAQSARTPDADPPRAPRAHATDTDGLKRYVVQPPRHRRHDSLWGIAERHLGDPLRWKEI